MNGSVGVPHFTQARGSNWTRHDSQFSEGAGFKTVQKVENMQPTQTENFESVEAQ